jgi:hypothetical protein
MPPRAVESIGRKMNILNLKTPFYTRKNYTLLSQVQED